MALSLSAPAFLALLLNTLGCSLFSPYPTYEHPDRSPLHPSPPLLPTLMVALCVALLLSGCPLWPASLRPPPRPLLLAMQLLVCLLIVEISLNCIWFPLEGIVYDMWSSFTQQADFQWKPKRSGIWCLIYEAIADLLRCPSIPGIASYTLSLTFLGCVLHATKAHRVFNTRNC